MFTRIAHCLNLLICAVVLVDSQTGFGSTEASAQLGLEAQEYSFRNPTVRTSEVWIKPSGEFLTRFGRREHFRFRIDLHGDLLVSSQAQHPASAPQALNTSGSPQFLEEKELVFEYRGRRSQLSIGSQILRWGISDIYDPLDLINSRRFEKPLETTKRAEWMIRSQSDLISRESLALSFEGFYIPIKKGPLLPSTSSAWLPREFYLPRSQSEAVLEMPSTVQYSYRNRRVLDDALQHHFGFRLKSRFENTEVFLQYDEGTTGFPALAVYASGTQIAILPQPRVRVNSNVELEEVLTRDRRFGASLVQQFNGLGGDWIFRLQVAKSEAVTPSLFASLPRTDVMGAIERSFSSSWVGTFTLLAQGFQNLLANSQAGSNDATSTNRLFDQAVAIGGRFGFTDETSAQVGVIWSKKDVVLNLNLNLAVTDQITLGLALTQIESAQDGVLGGYRNNDSMTGQLTALF